jgi:V8-like Glu-specific endopeptidase
MRGKILGLLAATALALPMAANAGGAGKTITGGSGAFAFTAQSNLIGQTSTATIAGGGDPIYQPGASRQKGVVSLIMNTSAGNFICSGTLLADRRSILTAAHCVSDGAGTANPLATTAFFNNTGNGDVIPSSGGAGITAITVERYFVNGSYTGEVIDQNDIAILRLSQAAPIWATSYDVDFSGDLTGKDFTVAGYGRRSDTGGSVGANLGAGRLREGDNKFDYRLGDAEFGGFFTDRNPVTGENFFGLAATEFSYLSDFDNGRSANDASCLLAGALSSTAGFGCDLGRGAREAGVAGGDSGGPQFAGGKVVSVTSYGLSFGAGFGDAVPGLNSSFGEFSGYVPTFIHEGFIRSVLAVPEPATWLQMIFGFGLIGSILRRRQAAKLSVA